MSRPTPQHAHATLGCHRGGACTTALAQMRPSYRNFFYPHQRWQTTGLRLAEDA